jgi:hypothetical protein
MTKQEALEIKKLWEEITTLEGLTEDDSFHSLEYLAKRLHEATKYNFPNTAFKLHDIEKQARRFIQTEIAVLAKELTEKLNAL